MSNPKIKFNTNVVLSFSDDSEYSDSDDDYVAKMYSKIDWECFPPNSVVVPLSKMPNIENDPENPKDFATSLQQDVHRKSQYNHFAQDAQHANNWRFPIPSSRDQGWDSI